MALIQSNITGLFEERQMLCSAFGEADAKFAHEATIAGNRAINTELRSLGLHHLAASDLGPAPIDALLTDKNRGRVRALSELSPYPPTLLPSLRELFSAFLPSPDVRDLVLSYTQPSRWSVSDALLQRMDECSAPVDDRRYVSIHLFSLLF